MSTANSCLPVACVPTALSPDERERSSSLRRALGAAISSIFELPNGYAFDCGSQSAIFHAVAEWIALERRCCPFLSFELGWPAGTGGFRLTVTGPAGTKEFLATELPALPQRE